MLDLFIFYFYLTFYFELIYTNPSDEYFGDITLYLNEICSYNGIPTIDKKTNQVICKCEEKYANEPREKYKKYINGHLVQCSYERKRKFLTLFLAAIGPFGIDYFYLGHYYIFVILLCFGTIVITFIIISFILSYKKKKKKEEIKFQKKLKRENKRFNLTNLTEINSRCVNSFIIVTRILTTILFIFWIYNFIIQGIGWNKDSNKVELENDLLYLFQKPEY